MTPEDQLMKSMVDHPAGTGRHRRQPTPVDCLGPTRDEPTQPAAGTAFDAVGLILAIWAATAVIALAGAISGHLAGPVGAIIGATLVAAGIHHFIRSI